MKTITLAKAQADLPNLLAEAVASHEPVQIAGETANAILVSADDWRALEETLYLLSIPGMRESIVEGLRTPLAECADEVAW